MEKFVDPVEKMEIPRMHENELKFKPVGIKFHQKPDSKALVLSWLDQNDQSYHTKVLSELDEKDFQRSLYSKYDLLKETADETSFAFERLRKMQEKLAAVLEDSDTTESEDDQIGVSSKRKQSGIPYSNGLCKENKKRLRTKYRASIDAYKKVIGESNARLRRARETRRICEDRLRRHTAIPSSTEENDVSSEGSIESDHAELAENFQNSNNAILKSNTRESGSEAESTDAQVQSLFNIINAAFYSALEHCNLQPLQSPNKTKPQHSRDCDFRSDSDEELFDEHITRRDSGDLNLQHGNCGRCCDYLGLADTYVSDGTNDPGASLYRISRTAFESAVSYCKFHTKAKTDSMAPEQTNHCSSVCSTDSEEYSLADKCGNVFSSFSNATAATENYIPSITFTNQSNSLGASRDKTQEEESETDSCNETTDMQSDQRTHITCRSPLANLSQADLSSSVTVGVSVQTDGPSNFRVDEANHYPVTRHKRCAVVNGSTQTETGFSKESSCQTSSLNNLVNSSSQTRSVLLVEKSCQSCKQILKNKVVQTVAVVPVTRATQTDALPMKSTLSSHPNRGLPVNKSFPKFFHLLSTGIAQSLQKVQSSFEASLNSVATTVTNTRKTPQNEVDRRDVEIIVQSIHNLQLMQKNFETSQNSVLSILQQMSQVVSSKTDESEFVRSLQDIQKSFEIYSKEVVAALHETSSTKPATIHHLQKSMQISLNEAIASQTQVLQNAFPKPELSDFFQSVNDIQKSFESTLKEVITILHQTPTIPSCRADEIDFLQLMRDMHKSYKFSLKEVTATVLQISANSSSKTYNKQLEAMIEMQKSLDSTIREMITTVNTNYNTSSKADDLHILQSLKDMQQSYATNEKELITAFLESHAKVSPDILQCMQNVQNSFECNIGLVLTALQQIPSIANSEVETIKTLLSYFEKQMRSVTEEQKNRTTPSIPLSSIDDVQADSHAKAYFERTIEFFESNMKTILHQAINPSAATNEATTAVTLGNLFPVTRLQKSIASIPVEFRPVYATENSTRKSRLNTLRYEIFGVNSSDGNSSFVPTDSKERPHGNIAKIDGDGKFVFKVDSTLLPKALLEMIQIYKKYNCSTSVSEIIRRLAEENHNSTQSKSVKLPSAEDKKTTWRLDAINTCNKILLESVQSNINASSALSMNKQPQSENGLHSPSEDTGSNSKCCGEENENSKQKGNNKIETHRLSLEFDSSCKAISRLEPNKFHVNARKNNKHIHRRTRKTNDWPNRTLRNGSRRKLPTKNLIVKDQIINDIGMNAKLSEKTTFREIDRKKVENSTTSDSDCNEPVTRNKKYTERPFRSKRRVMKKYHKASGQIKATTGKTVLTAKPGKLDLKWESGQLSSKDKSEEAATSNVLLKDIEKALSEEEVANCSILDKSKVLSNKVRSSHESSDTVAASANEKDEDDWESESTTSSRDEMLSECLSSEDSSDTESDSKTLQSVLESQIRKQREQKSRRYFQILKIKRNRFANHGKTNLSFGQRALKRLKKDTLSKRKLEKETSTANLADDQILTPATTKVQKGKSFSLHFRIKKQRTEKQPTVIDTEEDSGTRSKQRRKRHKKTNSFTTSDEESSSSQQYHNDKRPYKKKDLAPSAEGSEVLKQGIFSKMKKFKQSMNGRLQQTKANQSSKMKSRSQTKLHSSKKDKKDSETEKLRKEKSFFFANSKFKIKFADFGKPISKKFQKDKITSDKNPKKEDKSENKIIKQEVKMKSKNIKDGNGEKEVENSKDVSQKEMTKDKVKNEDEKIAGDERNSESLHSGRSSNLFKEQTGPDDQTQKSSANASLQQESNQLMANQRASPLTGKNTTTSATNNVAEEAQAVLSIEIGQNIPEKISAEDLASRHGFSDVITKNINRKISRKIENTDNIEQDKPHTEQPCKKCVDRQRVITSAEKKESENLEVKKPDSDNSCVKKSSTPALGKSYQCKSSNVTFQNSTSTSSTPGTTDQIQSKIQEKESVVQNLTNDETDVSENIESQNEGVSSKVLQESSKETSQESPSLANIKSSQYNYGDCDKIPQKGSVADLIPSRGNSDWDTDSSMERFLRNEPSKSVGKQTALDEADASEAAKLKTKQWDCDSDSSEEYDKIIQEPRYSKSGADDERKMKEETKTNASSETESKASPADDSESEYQFLLEKYPRMIKEERQSISGVKNEKDSETHATTTAGKSNIIPSDWDSDSQIVLEEYVRTVHKQQKASKSAVKDQKALKRENKTSASTVPEAQKQPANNVDSEYQVLLKKYLRMIKEERESKSSGKNQNTLQGEESETKATTFAAKSDILPPDWDSDSQIVLEEYVRMVHKQQRDLKSSVKDQKPLKGESETNTHVTAEEKSDIIPPDWDSDSQIVLEEYVRNILKQKRHLKSGVKPSASTAAESEIIPEDDSEYQLLLEKYLRMIKEERESTSGVKYQKTLTGESKTNATSTIKLATSETESKQVKTTSNDTVGTELIPEAKDILALLDKCEKLAGEQCRADRKGLEVEKDKNALRDSISSKQPTDIDELPRSTAYWSNQESVPPEIMNISREKYRQEMEKKKCSSALDNDSELSFEIPYFDPPKEENTASTKPDNKTIIDKQVGISLPEMIERFRKAYETKIKQQQEGQTRNSGEESEFTIPGFSSDDGESPFSPEESVTELNTTEESGDWLDEIAGTSKKKKEPKIRYSVSQHTFIPPSQTIGSEVGNKPKAADNEASNTTNFDATNQGNSNFTSNSNLPVNFPANSGSYPNSSQNFSVNNTQYVYADPNLPTTQTPRLEKFLIGPIERIPKQVKATGTSATVPAHRNPYVLSNASYPRDTHRPPSYEDFIGKTISLEKHKVGKMEKMKFVYEEIKKARKAQKLAKQNKKSAKVFKKLLQTNYGGVEFGPPLYTVLEPTKTTIDTGTEDSLDPSDYEFENNGKGDESKKPEKTKQDVPNHTQSTQSVKLSNGKKKPIFFQSYEIPEILEISDYFVPGDRLTRLEGNYASYVLLCKTFPSLFDGVDIVVEDVVPFEIRHDLANVNQYQIYKTLKPLDNVQRKLVRSGVQTIFLWEHTKINKVWNLLHQYKKKQKKKFSRVGKVLNPSSRAWFCYKRAKSYLKHLEKLNDEIQATQLRWSDAFAALNWNSGLI